MAVQYEELLANFKTIEDLSKLTIEDRRGNPDLQIGFVIKLYFASAHRKDVRARMLSLVEDYAKMLPDQITHYMPYEGSRLRRTEGFDYLGYFREHLETLSVDHESEGFDAELYGFPEAVDRDGPTPCHIGVVAGPAVDQRRLANEHNALGRLEAYLPADWARGKFSTLVDLFIRWGDIGHPIHGTLGLGLIMEEGGPRRSDTAFPFLKRFTGLDYPDRSLWQVRSEAAEGPVIRTTNWLTLIDKTRAEVLGGVETLLTELGTLCSVHPYADGVIIQAGATPAVGDRNRGDELPAYRAAARVLRPLRFEAFSKRGIFRDLPPPWQDREETMSWLQRFD